MQGAPFGRLLGAPGLDRDRVYMEDLVVLDVQDDGKGFMPSPSSDGRTGFGLAGMRERAESLQGSLQVESVPGEGTTISSASARRR